MKTFKTIAIFFILIGTIAFSMNALFNSEMFVFLQDMESNGIHFKAINFMKWITNINQSIGETNELTLTQPSRQWINITSSFVEQEFWDALGNNMALMLDWVIFGLNVIIYPFRLGCYLLKQVLAIIGLNMTEEHPLTWLITLIRFLTSLQIPYV